ncbi:MAG: phage tail protein [Chloroflexota bacterium]
MDSFDPLAEFRFAVEVDGLVTGWFTECSGLSMERQVTPQPAGGVNDYVAQLPGPLQWAKLTLKRGLAGPELWDWFQQGQFDVQVSRQSVSIIFYHPDCTEAQRWNLVNAFPVSWQGPKLNTTGNQAAIESLELACGGGSAVWGAVQRQAETQSGAAADQAQPEPGQSPVVNLQALADRVYALFKQELRIERERLGRRSW